MPVKIGWYRRKSSSSRLFFFFHGKQITNQNVAKKCKLCFLFLRHRKRYEIWFENEKSFVFCYSSSRLFCFSPPFCHFSLLFVISHSFFSSVSSAYDFRHRSLVDFVSHCRQISVSNLINIYGPSKIKTTKKEETQEIFVICVLIQFFEWTIKATTVSFWKSDQSKLSKTIDHSAKSKTKIALFSNRFQVQNSIKGKRDQKEDVFFTIFTSNPKEK